MEAEASEPGARFEPQLNVKTLAAGDLLGPIKNLKIIVFHGLYVWDFEKKRSVTRMLVLPGVVDPSIRDHSTGVSDRSHQSATGVNSWNAITAVSNGRNIEECVAGLVATEGG